MQIDPLSPDHYSDPYSVYRNLRQQSPVHWCDKVANSQRGAWHIMRYQDIHQLQRDTRLARKRPAENRNEATPSCPYLQMVSLQMPFRTRDKHVQIRSVITPPLSPSVLQSYSSIIERVVDLLLDDLIPKKQFDFVSQFAAPLAFFTTADFIGIPKHLRKEVHQIISQMIQIDNPTKNNIDLANDLTLKFSSLMTEVIDDEDTSDTDGVLRGSVAYSVPTSRFRKIG